MNPAQFYIVDTWVCGQNESDALKGRLVIFEFELFLIGIPSTLDVVVYSGSRLIFMFEMSAQYWSILGTFQN